jgi:sulfur carrier protein ThiS
LISKSVSAMKVRVKVYGTLRRRFPGYRHSEGIELDVPERTDAKGLLARLNISKAKGTLLIAENRILKAQDILEDGIEVDMLEAGGGG